MAEREQPGPPEEAFERWVEAFRGPLVGLLASWGPDWRTAEELAQDTFAEAWFGRARFRGDADDLGAVGAWLRGIAFHLHSAARRREIRARVQPIEPGDVVPGNMYFTTTRLHQELAGATFVDAIVDEAHDAESDYPFKGNFDFDKLDALVDEVGADRIPYVCMATCVNMAGGQPISLANLKQLRSWCDKHGIMLVHDMTRVAENAHFIQKREEAYKDTPIRDIVYEICSLTDAATMSAKKDPMVNIGGFLAMNDRKFYDQACGLVVVYEGLHTYGGMAGRDMEAMAIGLREAVEEDHQSARIGQVHYLGRKLLDAGIPIVKPIGSHAVFLDARAFLPHIDQDLYPAQTLAAELYIEAGVRSMERGNVSAGRDPETGKNRRPKLELVRLTLPRRVYTQAHMDVVAEAVCDVYARRKDIRGLRMVFEPEYLRFFQARFLPLQKERNSGPGRDSSERTKRIPVPA